MDSIPYTKKERQTMNFLWLLLGVIYLGGGWRFWVGFPQTNFTQSRLLLTALWPFLLVNKPYRQNFMKALKG
ncbi:MAG: hypothetical protein HC934_09345 [Acaryochloridaceae cyanobacterium SU_2_1]|nr:hypothetical protein [Acaryochloridaceae cyanobacterium SU_2_1]